MVSWRFEHLEVFAIVANKTREVVRAVERQNGNQEAGEEKDDDLHEIGPCRGF